MMANSKKMHTFAAIITKIHKKLTKKIIDNEDELSNERNGRDGLGPCCNIL